MAAAETSPKRHKPEEAMSTTTGSAPSTATTSTSAPVVPGGRSKLSHIHKAGGAEGKGPVPPIVSREAWIAARKALLVKEKELTRHRDEVTHARQQMPWFQLTKSYIFKDLSGHDVPFSSIFGPKKDIVIWHLMYDAAWDDPCSICSMFLDGFNGIARHVGQRAKFIVTAAAPYTKLAAAAAKKKWEFPIYSTEGTDFNLDFLVTPPPESKDTTFYNFGGGMGGPPGLKQFPGLSVFRRCKGGNIYNTYSSYARGLEVYSTVYTILDSLPYGREDFWPKHTYDAIAEPAEKKEETKAEAPKAGH